MKTLLVCERSGGHLFPALTLGKLLCQRQEDVGFFVTASFFKDYLRKQGFKVYGKSFACRNIVFEGGWRLIEALYLLMVLRPGRVIGFGGRDSFFLLLFSSILGLDTFIYEPNISFGRANRILSFFVRQVLCGFSMPPCERAPRSEESKFKIAGVPLRDNIKKVEREEALKVLGFDSKPVVLCFGGSQGASFLNKTFIEFINASAQDFNIIHLTGKREYFQISQLYNKIDRKAFVKDFYYSMEILYSAADLAICRSGASTLGEISYYKLPSILIPYPGGAQHQRKNACYFSERGAAYVFFQEDFSFKDFKQAAEKLICDSRLRQTFKDNLSKVRLGVSAQDFHKNIWG
ncbi:MAG: UDP-N-acetylglucosamine--N-acetylmuramyl-(pentapeptide) pyrophosphoryl-undecaprenol N-acetylglucosamine transferase [Candidatus Omnitrophota bacterium]|nr:MAG: UDP-N-acetylglucosamine--N-acetylmuramyl-(pentapeptide) pyrophosphoryl-undecaprenol N-acetylglucosamine transferase [Candidatus Omnitrophota bacterium]